MLDAYLRPGDGVLDIGANVGHYAARYAQAVGPTGRVLAIEPDPDSVAVARATCAMYPHVTIMSVAVSDTMGPATLYIDAGDHRRNSLWKANVVQDAGQTKTVQTVTLDHIASLVPNLRGIKIDAQGAEGAILTGGQETLTRPDLTWCVELWPAGLVAAGTSVDAVIGHFQAHGWRPRERTWDDVRGECARQTNVHGSIDVVVMR